MNATTWARFGRKRSVHLLVALVVSCSVSLAATFGSTRSATATAGSLEVVNADVGVAHANFGLRAVSPAVGGGPLTIGDVVFELDPGIATWGLCTVHGPDPTVDFSDSGAETGISPYQEIQCGRAYQQSVSFNKCTMTAVAHAFIHSWDSSVNYMGPTTVTITFKKTGATSGILAVQAWTPTKTLKVTGHTEGTVTMSTCP